MRLLIFSARNQLYQSAAAIASACHAAQRGRNVLLASAGPGHLLGTLLGQSLGPRPLELEPRLAAMEISALDEIAQRWEAVRPSLRTGLAARLRDIGSDELPSFPGMDAVAALLVAERARAAARFDLVVLDGPPPDALVRALSLPDVLRWMLRLIFGIDRGPGRSRSSQEAAIIPTALITPSMTAPLQDLRVVLEEQRARLDAATGARVRLVVPLPELGLPTLRSDLSGLGLYGLAVDELLVPGEPDQIDSASRHEFSQAAGRGRPTLRIGPLPVAPTDRASWARRGAALYRDGEVIEPATARPAAERELRLSIPFLDPKALDIAVANEEVVLRLGHLRRHVLLPGLAEGGRLRARVEGETLRLWVE